MTIEERANSSSPFEPHEWQEGYGLYESGFIQGAEDQMKIDAAEMAKLNDEWEQNLAIQRAMLIDKAVEWFRHQKEEIGISWFEEYEIRFREAMEE